MFNADQIEVTATVTDQKTATSLSALTADQAFSDSQIRLFLEMVLAWPGENSPGWINLHTNRRNAEPRGQPLMLGWAYKTLNDFLNQASRIGGFFFQRLDAHVATERLSAGTWRAEGNQEREERNVGEGYLGGHRRQAAS